MVVVMDERSLQLQAASLGLDGNDLWRGIPVR